MNTHIRTFLIATTILAAASTLYARVDTLTIAHVNDTHSHLAAGGRRDASLEGSLGGIARAATAIGYIRATSPNVLALHAGDLFVGDLFFNTFFGVPELRMMKQIGFDAMAVGNHEFDLTPAVLTQALDSGFVAGGFPLLSANLILTDTSLAHLRNYVSPFTIKQMGNLKVGIFGMTTPSTNLISLPMPAVISDQVLEIASAMVDTLKKQGCDVILMLSHLGIAYDQAVASAVPGIAAVIGGHDHFLVEQPIAVRNIDGDTTWVVQAEAHYHYLGKLTLGVENGKAHLLDYQMIRLDQSVPEEPTLKGVIAGLISQIQAVYGPVYSTAITNASDDFDEMQLDLFSNGPKDTPVDNLVSDAMRAFARTNIAVEPGGSTADKLYRGPITPDDAFKAIGYGFNTQNGLGFRLVTVDMPGKSLIGGIEFGLANIETGDDYLMQVSGMSYSYDPGRPAGSRLTGATVGALPLDTGATYSVAVNEFVLAFLDYLQLPYSNPRMHGDTTEFQVLAGYISAFDTIRPNVEGRVRVGSSSSVPARIVSADDDLRLASFPDPFQGSTLIVFHSPGGVPETVDIFNAAGVHVATPVDGVYPEGTHNVRFDASGLPAGIYFCRITIGSRSVTRVMHIVR